MQISDDLFLGPAYGGGTPDPLNPSLMERGVGPMGRVYVYDVLPLPRGLANIAVAQTPVANANFVLAAGAGVTFVGDATLNRYVLDTPRAVSLSSVGAANNVNVTIVGVDRYGQTLTQTIVGPTGGTVATPKTFAAVARVTVNGVAGAPISVGTADRFGLPIRVTDAGYVISQKWAGVADTGGFATADSATASALTSDVRGTYTPTSVADGVRRLVMVLAVPSIACGPNATRLGAYGVDNF
jgi:hypothetical protein